ncbi:MAG: hypothetical protein ABH882_06950 [Candidatus Omnitrophota bacterium]
MNLNYLFWDEIFSDDLIVEDPDSKSEPLDITFSRDENYNLSFEIKAAGEESREFTKRLRDKSPDILNVNSRHGGIIAEFHDVFFSQNIWTPKEITMKGDVSEIRLRYNVNKDAEAKTIIYWFLSNIKNTDIVFTRHSNFKTSGKAELKIEGIANDIIEIPILEESTGWDIMVLELNNKKFCLGTVSEKYTGKDYKGILLRFDDKNFPTDEEIKTITNFLSFICGGILIPVGYIKFGDKYSILEQVYKSNFYKDVKKIMMLSPMPAIPLDSKYIRREKISFAQIEEQLSSILKKYSDNEQALILDKIIVYLKCARLSFLEVTLQPLTTAIDLLQQIFFKGKKTSSQGKYLKDEQYSEILSKYLESIEKDLDGCLEKNIILNKIKKANNYTLSDREKRFFDEIGLKIGDIENAILMERNKSIHGIIGKRDYDRLLALTYGAYALTNRIILKLLDHRGCYVDYSTHEFPYRNIDEALKGPEGKGTI